MCMPLRRGQGEALFRVRLEEENQGLIAELHQLAKQAEVSMRSLEEAETRFSEVCKITDACMAEESSAVAETQRLRLELQEARESTDAETQRLHAEFQEAIDSREAEAGTPESEGLVEAEAEISVLRTKREELRAEEVQCLRGGEEYCASSDSTAELNAELQAEHARLCEAHAERSSANTHLQEENECHKKTRDTRVVQTVLRLAKSSMHPSPATEGSRQSFQSSLNTSSTEVECLQKRVRQAEAHLTVLKHVLDGERQLEEAAAESIACQDTSVDLQTILTSLTMLKVMECPRSPLATPPLNPIAASQSLPLPEPLAPNTHPLPQPLTPCPLTMPPHLLRPHRFDPSTQGDLAHRHLSNEIHDASYVLSSIHVVSDHEDSMTPRRRSKKEHKQRKAVRRRKFPAQQQKLLQSHDGSTSIISSPNLGSDLRAAARTNGVNFSAADFIGLSPPMNKNLRADNFGIAPLSAAPEVIRPVRILEQQQGKFSPCPSPPFFSMQPCASQAVACEPPVQSQTEEHVAVLRPLESSPPSSISDLIRVLGHLRSAEKGRQCAEIEEGNDRLRNEIQVLREKAAQGPLRKTLRAIPEQTLMRLPSS